MSKLLAMMMKPKNYMYATIKGSLTENNGVVSGFSSSNYLALQQPFTLNADTVAEIVIKVNIPTLKASNAFLATINQHGIYLYVNSSGNIVLYLGDGTNWIINQLNGTHILSANTDYYIKINFNNNVVTVSISDDNITWIQDIQSNMSLNNSSDYIIKLGERTSTQYFNGSIDLNQSYIKIANTKYQLQAVVGYTVVGSPTIVDGVVSGFSNNDYLELPHISSLDNIEMQISFTLGNTIERGYVFMYRQVFQIYIPLPSSTIGINSYTWNDSVTREIIPENEVEANAKYVIKMTKIGNVFNFSYSKNDGTFINSLTYTYTEFEKSNTPRLGSWNNITFNGSIDLNKTYIKVNNKLWFNGQPA